MKLDGLTNSPVITILVVLFAAVGGALVLICALTSGVDPALRLTYGDYLKAMTGPLVALGIAKAGKSIGNKS
jgi:hypothetical protein